MVCSLQLSSQSQLVSLVQRDEQFQLRSHGQCSPFKLTSFGSSGADAALTGPGTILMDFKGKNCSFCGCIRPQLVVHSLTLKATLVTKAGVCTCSMQFIIIAVPEVTLSGLAGPKSH